MHSTKIILGGIGLKKYVLFFGLLVLLVILPLSSAESWPMYRHDAQHTGYASSSAPANNSIRWTYETDNGIFSSPAVYENKVYVGSFDKNLYCLDANTGTLLWSYEIGNPIVKSSPAISDNKVFIGSSDGIVYCLNAENGTKIWSFLTGAGIDSSPVVFADSVFISSQDQKLYCLETGSGQEVWNFTTPRGISSSPAYYANKVYVGCSDSILYCLEAETGMLLWNYSTGSPIYASPAISNGKVFIGSDKLYAFDAMNGTLNWSYDTGTTFYSSPAVDQTRVYVGCSDYNLYCVMKETGYALWHFPTNGYLDASPAVADGKVYIGSQDNTVYCVDAATGQEKWTYETGGNILSSPAIFQGKLYISSLDHLVYCFGNTPPNKPSRPYGAGGKSNTELIFSTKASDPEEDALSYLFDWGDGTTSGWLGPYPSGNTIIATHSWSLDGTYNIQVQTRDSYGSSSAWSDSFSVKIFAESTTDVGWVFGTITGPTNNPIPQARVCVVSEQDISHCYLSDENGVYQSDPLIPGTYSLRISKEGYEDATKENVLISTKTAFECDLSLVAIETNQVTNEEHLVAEYTVGKVIEEGHVGAKVTVNPKNKDPIIGIDYYTADLEIINVLSENPDELVTFTVSAPEETAGTFIVAYLEEITESIVITYDGEEIEQMSVAQFFNPEFLEEPAYALLSTSEGTYVCIWTPHFSTHIISISSLEQVLNVLTTVLYYLAITLVIAVLIIAPIIYIERKKRS